MSRLYRYILITASYLMFLSLLLPGSASASQVYGHLYFAEALLQTEAGSYLARQNNTRAAFLLGSLSPDSTWIGHMLTQPEVRARLMQRYEVEFPSFLPEHATYIDDIHQKLPRQFTLQLIQAALTEEEQAFAIGWLSHYAVDSFMHDLINRHGGFVSNPDLFDSAEMKQHDYLEALEMKHVLQLNGFRLRDGADAAGQSKLPLQMLHGVFAAMYSDNPYYAEHRSDFNRVMTLSSHLMLDSTRWYGYQSQHTPAQIKRMKKLIRRFRPHQGKLLEVLPDLPPLKQYETEKSTGQFLPDWQLRSRQLIESSHLLIVNATAYYWWRNRTNPVASEIAAETLNRLQTELTRMNPADNLMQPRQHY